MRLEVKCYRTYVVLAIGVVWLVLSAVPALAQESGAKACYVVANQSGVRVRNGPSVDEYGVIGVLSAGQALPVTGRNAAGDWYAVEYTDEDGQQAPAAWIAASVVQTDGTCDGLPFVDEPAPPQEFTDLMAVPVLPESLDTEALRAVFERGQALGNDPHVFTKVGDCNTDTSYFMTGFDMDDYDLGPYAELEPTIDFFAGSFEHVSLAGQVGFNALTVLEPLWVDPSICNPGDGEGPLACEYRRERPSVVVMMFGPNDMINLTNEQFEQALRDIIDLSLDQGVIPVLTTFTWHHDKFWQKSLELNMITVEIAQEYDLPLINFWRVARDLPNFGLVADYTHLTDTGYYGANRFRIAFSDGEETVSGYALRNLLTLQMLDHLRRDVLEGPQ